MTTEHVPVELDDGQEIAAAVIIVGREGSLEFVVKEDHDGINRRGLAHILRAYAETLELEAALTGEGHDHP